MNFEIVPIQYRKYADTDIIIPKRSTKKSAGYDFYLNDNLTINPGETIKHYTDIRVSLDDDKLLWLTPRSSTGKLKIKIPQTAGIIDPDYYDNEETGGNIILMLYNYGTEKQFIRAGDRLVQGIILPFYVTSDDHKDEKKVRGGGLGSTGK